jgi:hypothetical protein
MIDRQRVQQLVLIAGMAITSAVSAQEQRDTVFVWGAGTDTCGAFLIALQKHENPSTVLNWQGEQYAIPTAVYVQWLSGFLSRENWARGTRKEPIAYRGDWAGMAMWMKNCCEKNPTKNFIDGAQAFINAHR